MTSATAHLPAEDTPLAQALHLGVGLLVTVILFTALSLARHVEIPAPAAPPAELTMVALAPPPPSAPEAPSKDFSPSAGTPQPYPVAVQGTVDLPPSPSDSPIRVLARRPAMGPVVVPDLIPSFALPRGLFKPNTGAELDDERKVYTTSEVEQPPVIVSRKVPDISRRLYDSVKDPRLIALILVNTSGQVEKLWLLRSSENQEFDTAMLDALHDWEFRPAVHHGRAVRCWVQQPVYVRLPNSSPFSAH